MRIVSLHSYGANVDTYVHGRCTMTTILERFRQAREQHAVTAVIEAGTIVREFHLYQRLIYDGETTENGKREAFLIFNPDSSLWFAYAYSTRELASEQIRNLNDWVEEYLPFTDDLDPSLWIFDPTGVEVVL